MTSHHLYYHNAEINPLKGANGCLAQGSKMSRSSTGPLDLSPIIL